MALAIRLGVIYNFTVPVEKDALEYDKIAVSLSQGRGFEIDGHPTSQRPPMYPLFLSLVYGLFGHSHEAATAGNALLGAAACIAAYLIGREIKDLRTGTIAATLTALHPSFEVATRLYSENLFIPLVGLSTLVCIKVVRDKRLYLYILAGFLIGLSTLTRQTAGLLLFFIAPLMLLGQRDKQRITKGILAAVTAFLIVIVPWQTRNWFMKDRVVNQDLLNFAFAFANYPLFSGSNWWTVFDMEKFEMERDRGVEFVTRKAQELGGQNEGLSKLKLVVFDKICGNPKGFIKLCTSRIAIFWLSPPVGTYFIKEKGKTLAGWWMGINYLLLGTVFWGGYLSLREGRVAWIVLGLLLYFTLFHGLTHSIRRYSYTVVPEMMVLSAVSISTLYNRWKGLWLKKSNGDCAVSV